MITKLEVKRQAVHIILGLTIVLLLFYDIINYIALVSAFLVFSLFSFVVMKGHYVPGFTQLLEMMERDSEKKGFRAKGLLFYLLGCILVVVFFDKDIALASIIILALGDSISRLVGPYGYLKHPFNNIKFIEGIIIGGLVAAAGAMFFVTPLYAILASVFAMFIESLDIEINDFKIDDNLIIPVISGVVMLLLRMFVL